MRELCMDRDPLWPSGKALGWQALRGTSVRIRFGSPFSSKFVVCGHRLATLSLTINEPLKMALIAADLNAEVILVVTDGYIISLFPHGSCRSSD